MSNIMKGIVDEGEEVAVIYIDGKPSAKYAKKHEAERDAEFMRKRHPNKKIEIKHEVRETEAKKGADGKRCWKGKRYAGTENGKDKCIPVKEEAESKWEVAIEYGPTANHTAKIKVSAPDADTAQSKALAQFKKKFPDRRGMVGDCTQIKEAANPAQQAAIAIAKKKKAKANEGVIVGHDANDPEIAVLGGAGTMSLSRLKKKAQGEAEQLANDLTRGRFKAAAYNIKQLENTLKTIAAAEDEMEKKYFGEGNIDEGLGDTVKKAALGLGTAAALAASPVAAQSVNTGRPEASQQANQPKVYKEKFSTASGANAKKYGLTDLRGDPFSPGQDEQTLLQNIQKIHDGRPQEIGRKIGKLELIPSDNNQADYIARIPYENGQLDIYLQKGGMLKSALVPFINNTPSGKKKKYIMLWLTWTVGKPTPAAQFDVNEDYTGEFAAEKTSETNPYGGQRDIQHRGAISETPTDNPTGASGEGGWRRTDLDEYREMSPALKAAQQNLIALRNKEKAVNVPGKRERAPRDKVELDKPKPASVLTKGAQEVDPDTADAIAAFLAKGGEIKKGRPGKAPPTGRQQASKHIGGGGKYRKKSDTPGQGANYRGAAIVAVEEDTAYASGMGQGGNAGQSYRKFKPKSAGTFKKESSIMKGLKR